MGISIQKIDNSFQPIKINNLLAKSVSCGGYHTAVITPSYHIVAWGSNQYGQIGIGLDNEIEIVDEPSPVEIQSIVPIYINCGENNTSFTDVSGDVYVWGYLLSPIAGQHQTTPRKLESLHLKNQFISRVICGKISLAFLSDKTLSNTLVTLGFAMTQPLTNEGLVLPGETEENTKEHESSKFKSQTTKFKKNENSNSLGILPQVRYQPYSSLKKDMLDVVDQLNSLQNRMHKWIYNNTNSWLPIIEVDKSVFVFHPNQEEGNSETHNLTLNNMSDKTVSVTVVLPDEELFQSSRFVLESPLKEFKLERKSSKKIPIKCTAFKEIQTYTDCLFYLEVSANAKSKKTKSVVRHFFVCQVRPAEKSTTNNILTESELEEKRVLVETMCTFVPKNVANKFFKEPTPPSYPTKTSFPAAILFVDISGFTSLNERLNKLGEAGPEKVTKHINNYYSQLIHVVRQHGGDIIKFAGDAMICMFGSVESGQELPEVIIRSVQCGIEIQTNLTEYDSNMGFKLTLHVGVGCGYINAIHGIYIYIFSFYFIG